MSSQPVHLPLGHLAEPLGRRQRKAAATRRSLLEAGLALFESTPLALISVQDITDGADVAKGVFYLHFRSRDDYLLELWREVQGLFLERVEAAMAGRKSLRSRVEALIRIYADLPRSSQREVMFWMRMSSYIVDEIGQPGNLLSLRQAYFQSLAELLCGQATQEALDIAGTIDACCWGLIRHQLALKMEPLPDEALLARVLPSVKQMLRRPDQGAAV